MNRKQPHGCPYIDFERERLEECFPVAKWREAEEEIKRLKTELSSVKDEVPCPECHGAGAFGVYSEFKYPCYEDYDNEIVNCEDIEISDCLKKEKKGPDAWHICSSGNKSGFKCETCPACNGTGKKYPEGK